MFDLMRKYLVGNKKRKCVINEIKTTNKQGEKFYALQL